MRTLKGLFIDTKKEDTKTFFDDSKEIRLNRPRLDKK